MQDETPTPTTGEAPTVVVRETQQGPNPVEPMKEGPPLDGWLPPELVHYKADWEERREKLTVWQQAHFDSLWLRATGRQMPGLSGRERQVLISYLEGTAP